MKNQHAVVNGWQPVRDQIKRQILPPRCGKIPIVCIQREEKTNIQNDIYVTILKEEIQ